MILEAIGQRVGAMVEKFKRRQQELEAYSEKSLQLMQAEKILVLFWTQHTLYKPGEESQKWALQQSVISYLQSLPRSIRGITVGWSEPILREPNATDGKILTLGELEEFTAGLAKEIRMYRPVWYAQEANGKLVRHWLNGSGNLVQD